MFRAGCIERSGRPAGSNGRAEWSHRAMATIAEIVDPVTPVSAHRRIPSRL